MNKDDKIYAEALDEFNSGIIDRNTMAKAFIISNGDPEAAKYKYLNLRVEKLKMEYKSRASMELMNKAAFGIASSFDKRKQKREADNRQKELIKKEKEEKARLKKEEKRIIKDKHKAEDNKIIGIWAIIIVLAVFGYLGSGS